MNSCLAITARRNGIRLIICFAAVLWISNLGADSLWLDEAVSVQRANFGFTELLQTVYGVGTNPPLHYIVLWGCVRLFGSSEFSVRLPSALCALATLLLVYKIGSRLYNRRVGTLAALLAALSSYQLYFAQEARAYALLAMLSLFSLYFFYRLLTEAKWRLVLGYILSSSLMLYAHPYAPFIIIMQNIYIVFIWLANSRDVRLNWKRWIPMQLVVLAAFLPWLSRMFGKVSQIQSRPLVITEPFWVDIPGVFKAYAGDNTLLGLYMILLTGLAAISVVRWKRIKRGTRKRGPADGFIRTAQFRGTSFLVLWLLAPILIPFIISKISSPIFSSRYTVVASYACYLLVARGICCITNKTLRRTTVAVLLIGLTATLIQHSLQTDREPWRNATRHIENNALPGEPVVFYARYCQVPYDYYAARKDLATFGIPSKGPAHQVDDRTLKELSERIQDYPRIWVVFSHSRRNEKKITDYLRQSYDMAEQIDYYGIRICQFGPKAETPY